MEATLVMDVTTVVDEHGAPSQEPGDQRDSCKDEQGREIRARLESFDEKSRGTPSVCRMQGYEAAFDAFAGFQAIQQWHGYVKNDDVRLEMWSFF